MLDPVMAYHAGKDLRCEQLVARVTVAEKERLLALAEETCRTPSEYVRWLLLQQFKRLDQKMS